MKCASLLTLNLAVLMLVGCGSTPTRVDKGPIKAATFSFAVRKPGSVPAQVDTRETTHALIQNSISRNLEGKGLSQLASGGDVTVAYLVVVGNNVTTEAINTYFGYGRDFSALHDKPHDAYTSNRNPNYFEAGTLLVDIIDAKTYKLLKRSYVVRPLLRNPSDEVRADHIREAVDAVLLDVRIRR